MNLNLEYANEQMKNIFYRILMDADNFTYEI